MVTETLEEQVIALVRKHYGTVITGCSPEITPGSDIDADIGMDWADAEGLMEDFFEKFSVDKASFNIKTYYPDPPMGTLLKNLFRREKELPEVPQFTVNMLIESARAGRWLY
ncbi:DUF1493 family protein [Serratia sp. SRS-8-S-2018]|uniref:DUF1493 family protein n=1 Tax=Serratia sp. SRS-8-S-2018 TaxID=2591107 RepID=UPI00113FF94E|nr:DUF1493 family protein [Serratia sp. SRS-8-S-2018]TPW45430.1 DUF1493 family protein [Serratia sp. SRS-8-S-2018]HEJ7033266.1 DUF1493 family protein [Serratia marcescens]